MTRNNAIGSDGLQTLLDVVEALDDALPSDADFDGVVILPPHPKYPNGPRVEVAVMYREGKAYVVVGDPQLEDEG